MGSGAWLILKNKLGSSKIVGTLISKFFILWELILWMISFNLANEVLKVMINFSFYWIWATSSGKKRLFIYWGWC